MNSAAVNGKKITEVTSEREEKGRRFDLHSARIILRPHANVLVQMVRSQNGGISREIVEVVHDNSHKQVEHEEGAEENEGDEVDVGDIAAAFLVWVARARLTARTIQHDRLPGLTGCTTE